MSDNRRGDDFISTREAAEMLGVALRTVQLWVEAGVLTAWKTAGGHRRVVRASVEALLQQKAAALAAVPVARRGARTAESAFRLLVIEDDPALLRLFELQVAGWGLPVELVTAKDGFDGLLEIGRRPPDLVITDLRLPGIDGFEMLRALRANPEHPAIDVIVITALAPSEVAARGGLPPDVPVFAKPVPFAEIERLVRGRIAARAGDGPR